MKKKLTLALLLVASLGAFAQQTNEKEKDSAWTTEGNINLLFNQSAFNADWLGGGTSNMAGNLSVSYGFNYTKNDWTWDNKILLDYGITKVKNEEFTKKTNDRLEFNSILGKKAGGNWYYSAFLNFKTQMDKGFTYGTLDDGTEYRVEYTHLLSPGYLQIGPGALWKKSDNLKVNIAPATSKLVFVDKDFTSYDGYVDGDYFGVDANSSTRFEFGAALSGYAKFNIMENVSAENILALYSNYLEDPQNVDIDYTLNVVMKINKYLTTNFTFQAIYDDNAARAFQIREVFGLGIGYKF
ncbi:protein of unknown function precursor [Neptunitalea chrysea]|uniref:DUF3078 domain-containing protein n=1 Tax=Neptunitalea chrysea TaxID=1647581 RepID=A0A9W6B8G9_9FLAO|nr:DUF3078 domain-containing protein [Neptunitalea chrysea]GLB53912.1 protein of unknown function precursor [Neptunitalea chrysea]